MRKIVEAVIETLLSIDDGGLDVVKDTLNRELIKEGYEWSWADYCWMFDEILFGLEERKMLATVLCR